jgi:hypothetical protein
LTPGQSCRQLQAIGRSQIMSIQETRCQLADVIAWQDLSPVAVQDIELRQSFLFLSGVQLAKAMQSRDCTVDLD